MALITYLIAPCAGGTEINVDFSGSSLPAVGGTYYLTFTGLTTIGCYQIAGISTGSVDKVDTMSTNYGNCTTCLNNVPTPTPTSTPTITPTITKTPTQTLTQTPTLTQTQTQTLTNTPTQTLTQTPSVTTTKTPTPTITPTNTQTTTNTQTLTQTPSVTTTKTPTPTITPSVTLTPTITPSVTTTTTSTPTKTPTQTPTLTPSETPYGVFQSNLYYNYGTGQTGSFSGGTWNSSLPNVPHPISYANLAQDGKKGTIIQMNAITIGGFNGLNN